MPIDVTHGGALVAGILSFVSPCVLPLVPPYLCYIGGVSLDQLTGGEGSERVARHRIAFSALAFVLGFSTIFILLGATASVLGRLVASQLGVLSIVAGGVIIAMGLHFLGVFKIGLMHRQARLELRNHPAGPIGAYFVGLAFAIGWTPCIGPVLAAILAVAGSEQTVTRGAVLLAAYSLGLGLPFILAGFFAGSFMHFMRRFRGHVGSVEKVMGALLVLTGILFITGHMTTFSFWLLNTFPGLAQFG
jgi:cytochrome c-type biogenesis protein